MMPVRRILLEKRSAILPLVVGLIVNIGAYVLVVYPLGVKVSNAAARAESAGRAVSAAERELASARAIVAGKGRADQELAAFYEKVLPPDLSGARRITYARLPALARKANLRYLQRHFEVEQEKDSHLGRLKIKMILEGDYENVRQFLYDLETAPEFLILDDVELAQGTQANSPLILTLELSTYFRTGANGA